MAVLVCSPEVAMVVPLTEVAMSVLGLLNEAEKDNGSWARIDFRYEKLPTFCFLCRILGHGDNFCPKVVQGIDLMAEKPYGAWLRTGSRNSPPTSGQRWVAPESTIERNKWIAPGMEGVEQQGFGNDKEPVESATGGMASGEASSKLP
nr:uncharacterized protein LOC109174453 [Ipomoea batatas]